MFPLVIQILFLPDRLWMTEHSALQSPVLSGFLTAFRHFNRQLKKLFNASASGSKRKKSMKNISKESFLSTLVPFPPLPEQKKIARILSTIDNKLALIDQQITATQTLKKGLMQKLFSEGVGTQDANGQWQPHTEFKDSELGRIPAGWSVSKLASLIEKLESGVSVNGEDRTKSNDEIAVLKISSVTYGSFDPSQHKVIIEKDIFRARLTPRKGQILVSRSNTESLVGASVYVNANYPDLFLPDKLWQTVPFDNAPLVMRWLSYVLASTEMREIISGMATGTSGSMKNITKGEFLSLSVALPPVLEQHEISKVLSSVDCKLQILASQKTQTQQLKKGLMQKLLTGQIRVKPEPQDH